MAFPSGYTTLDTDIVDATATDNGDAGKDHATVHNELADAINALAGLLTTAGDLPSFNGTDGVRASHVVNRRPANDTVNTSTALQDDAHLTFPIGANEVWVVEFRLFVSSVNSSNPDLKVAITAPAGAVTQGGII